jgi:hypothetical protein
MRVTFPSAGETTTSGSDGGTRFGSRKKNAMKTATNNNHNPVNHKPKRLAATLNTSGTMMYGMLSLTIRKTFLLLI